MSPRTHPPYAPTPSVSDLPSLEETLVAYQTIINYHKAAIDALNDADSIDHYCASHITPMRTSDDDTQIIRHMLRD
jgi:hypothetical protein